MAELKTYGDLKKVIKAISLKQKAKDIVGGAEGRTVTSIKENKMKKSQIKQLIKEEIQNILNEQPAQPTVKQTAASKAYQQTVQKATSVQSKAGQIKSINDLPGAFQVWFDSLGLKGKPGISQTVILSKVKETLTKMGIK